MKLVVFDLDFTLWNAGGTWIDHSYPPYRKVNGTVYDSANSQMLLYPDSKEILKLLNIHNYKVAAASRTHEPSWAIELMRLYDIRKYFHYLEIYPGSKIEHFNQLNSATNIPFEEMIFFDDEMRNIEDVSSLGVYAVLVDRGINMQLVKENLELH